MRSGNGPAAGAAALVLLLGGSALAQEAAHSDTGEGKRLFKEDCAGCHKWHGNGGGGYGGGGPSPRPTPPPRGQNIENLGRGPPGTRHAHHKRGAHPGGGKARFRMTPGPPRQGRAPGGR